MTKVIPVGVLAAVLSHGKGDLSERIEAIKQGVPKLVARQNMATILNAAHLWYITDDNLQINDLGKFIRRSVKVKAGDPADDYWGTPYRHRLVKGKFYLYSAGPDRRFGSEDDLFDFIRLGNY